MKNIDPKNGAYIYGTRFAIDRHVSTDIKTGATYIHWRLLEVNRNTRGYDVVSVYTDPVNLTIELVGYHTQRDCHFKTTTDYIDTVNDTALTCESAIEGIQQHAVLNGVKHD